jgi:hypothetical protein
MWEKIGALLGRAGEVLGIEMPELPDVSAVGDAAAAAAEAIGDAGAGLSADLGTDVAAAGETVAGAVDEAAAAAQPLTDLLPGSPR